MKSTILSVLLLTWPLFISSTLAIPTEQLPSTTQPRNATLLHATPWVPCQDLPDLECRSVTVPRFYEPTIVRQGLAAGTLDVLERRVVAGTPRRHVWLLQGGPSENSDITAVINVPQIAAALGTDYIIQMPYERGSPHTEAIPDYPDYPANFSDYLLHQSIPIQAYTTTNIARDVISSVRAAKALDSSVEHYAIAVSYGTYLLNRILQLEPDLFNTNIFDGSNPYFGLGESVFKTQGLGLITLANLLADDCSRSPSCVSWDLDALVTFAESLSHNSSNPCFDALVAALDFAGPSDQLFSQLAYNFIFLNNNPVPVAIFHNRSVDVQALVPNILDWYRGNHSQPELIAWDNRVWFWALTNQLAQCSPTSTSRFNNLLAQVFLPVMAFTSQFGAIVTAPPFGLLATSAITAAHIAFSEQDSPPWTAAAQRAVQVNTLLREPATVLDSRDALREAQMPFLSTLDAHEMGPAMGVRGNVVLLNGAMDPNSPIAGARAFFHAIQVAEGYCKHFFRFANAGHAILLAGWSSCTDAFLRGYLGDDGDARARFQECLAVENRETLDWGLRSLKEVAGVDVWEGLEKRD